MGTYGFNLVTVEWKSGDQSRHETLFESHYESCHVDIVPSSRRRLLKNNSDKLESITFQQ